MFFDPHDISTLYFELGKTYYDDTTLGKPGVVRWNTVNNEYSYYYEPYRYQATNNFKESQIFDGKLFFGIDGGYHPKYANDPQPLYCLPKWRTNAAVPESEKKSLFTANYRECLWI